MSYFNVGAGFPGQLRGFNYSVEQDNRPGFFLHHIIHLEWEPPQGESSRLLRQEVLVGAKSRCQVSNTPMSKLRLLLYRSQLVLHDMPRIYEVGQTRGCLIV